MSHTARRCVLAFLAGAVVVTIGALAVSPAAAHGFSSVAYVDVSSSAEGQVRTELQLEYDLLVVSAADSERDDPLFREGTAAFEDGDATSQATVLDDHAATVLAYVTERFGVAAGGEQCIPLQVGKITMSHQQGVPYAVLVLDYSCPAAGGGHVLTSHLFGDSEGFVTGTKTILSYEVDNRSGSAALDSGQPSFSTEQSTGERFWEFFRLGAEHLLSGIDHILFLLALIVGSRRFREVVLTATAFTIAHSVTFILAATGVISAPAMIVEPIIALSIAVVAAWHLWRIWRRGKAADTLDSSSGPLGLDRAGWLRLAVVFLFGLAHGLGFASALGIHEPWSWTLLWSLLVFNLGIEVVQLAIIAALFPLLALLRRRAPRIGLWATGALAVSVFVAGLIWFVQRVFGQ
ncbi:HupE/UreJ family protein [Luethyella okanaganae]|uniref:HupE/UreJ family protein n=1 Tax=Luethyella okanaganae TaxID=69372 RepID=A0ABW1VBM6_9MICO